MSKYVQCINAHSQYRNHHTKPNSPTSNHPKTRPAKDSTIIIICYCRETPAQIPRAGQAPHTRTCALITHCFAKRSSSPCRPNSTKTHIVHTTRNKTPISTAAFVYVGRFTLCHVLHIISHHMRRREFMHNNSMITEHTAASLQKSR